MIEFKQTRFFTTVNNIKDLPKQSVAEIAICGRSNVGKSSLLNVLTNQKRLAHTSKTPGRTQYLNYFAVDTNNSIFFVDLPGYGYAQVPQAMRNHWHQLLTQYLYTRKQLIGVVLIMDCRHILKPSDYTILHLFKRLNKPIHIVLSKADKLNNQQKQNTQLIVEQTLIQDGITNFTLQLFSALKQSGVTELAAILNALFEEAIRK